MDWFTIANMGVGAMIVGAVQLGYVALRREPLCKEVATQLTTVCITGALIAALGTVAHYITTGSLM